MIVIMLDTLSMLSLLIHQNTVAKGFCNVCMAKLLIVIESGDEGLQAVSECYENLVGA